MVFSSRNFVGETFALFFAGQIRWKRDAFASSTEFLRQRVADLGLARRNIDTSASVNETACDHLSYAPASSGDEHDFSRYIKEWIHGAKCRSGDRVRDEECRTRTW